MFVKIAGCFCYGYLRAHPRLSTDQQ